MAEFRRQNNGRRCQIVQHFVLNIEDDTERLICFLFMQGYKHSGICRMLRLKSKELYKIKVRLGERLKEAGIRLMEG